MIALFNPRRTRLLAGVIAVALVQLGATVAVAHALHGPGPSAWTLAATAAVLGFACEALLRRLSEGLGLDYVTAVREGLFRHLMAIDPAVIERRRHGAMLQSFVGDLTALRQWVAEGIMRAILAVIALSGLLIWLCFAAPGLGMAALAIVALAGASGAAVLTPLARAVRQVRRERGRVSAFASERLAASAAVLACARTGSEARRLGRRVERLNAASLRRAWLTGLLRALPHLAATAMVITAVLVDQATQRGGMAGLVLVIGIIGLALRDLARAAELAVPGRISRRRITRLLALPRLRQPAPAPRVRSEARQLVLDQLVIAANAAPITAATRKGEVILIDGEAELASALFKALAGLASPLGGTGRWNGNDLFSLRPVQRRTIVGLAGADLPVLPGGNGLNLRFRAPDASPQELAELAQAWGIDPLGADEKPHRLALVRALLGKPPLLLLAPDDRTLAPADAARLADAIGCWPGVVLLATRHPLLTNRATRHWHLTAAGLIDRVWPELSQTPCPKDRGA
ncbi:ABC transporter transmembrane domain-containing protein [Novosphingobium sp. B 225]|uniref:ABC transporter transmembrane domain-containing protein n=1 Tax=Novosphingobium sp. B 225 TaxID=1961849 RepID=UPI000B4BA088|nr:ABC transporter ATP-binding protein [Novosphingobium sp. B 225]